MLTDSWNNGSNYATSYHQQQHYQPTGHNHSARYSLSSLSQHQHQQQQQQQQQQQPAFQSSPHSQSHHQQSRHALTSLSQSASMAVNEMPMIVYQNTLSLTVQPTNGSPFTQYTNILLTQSHSQPKSLTLQLTSDSDPYFYYGTTVTDADYATIKRDQHIAVDFAAFPSELKRLLELCHSDGAYGLSLSVSGSDATIFHIVHTNHFRHVDYLTLAVKQCSDSQLKSLLRDKVFALRDDIAALNGKIESLAESQQHGENERQSLSQSLAQQRQHYEDRLQSLALTHCEEVTTARKKLESEIASTNQKHEERLSLLTSEHSQRLQSLQSQYSELTEKWQSQQSQCQSLTLQLQNKSELLEFKDKELAKNKNEIEILFKTNENLAREKDDENRRSRVLESKNFEFENKLNATLLSLTNTENQLKLEKEQRLLSDALVAALKTRCDDQQSKAESQSAEISRLADTVTKLNQKILSLKEKNDKKKQLLSSQESQLVELDEKLKDKDFLLNESQLLTAKLTSDATSIKERFAALEKLHEELKQQNSEHLTTIHFLNQKENEKQMTRNFLPSSASQTLATLFPASTAAIGGGSAMVAPLSASMSSLSSLLSSTSAALLSSSMSAPSPALTSSSHSQPAAPLSAASAALLSPPAASSAALSESIAKVLGHGGAPFTPASMPSLPFQSSASKFYSVHDSSLVTSASQPGRRAPSVAANTPIVPVEKRLSAIARSHLGLNTLPPPPAANGSVSAGGKPGGAVRVLSSLSSFQAQPSSGHFRPQVSLDNATGQVKIIDKPSNVANNSGIISDENQRTNGASGGLGEKRPALASSSAASSLPIVAN